MRPMHDYPKLASLECFLYYLVKLYKKLWF